MKVPKHYRLHEATNDFVFLDEGAVVATNGTILARVPLTSDGIRLDGTEGPPRAIPAKAWADAVRGSKGEGSLDLSEPDRVVAQSGEGKVQNVHDCETRPVPTRLSERLSAPQEAVRIAVDAEALVALQRALGASEGVMLHVAEDGAYYVEPVSTSQRGPSGLISRIRWTD